VVVNTVNSFERAKFSGWRRSSGARRKALDQDSYEGKREGGRLNYFTGGQETST
jgi:hypothetical protein